MPKTPEGKVKDEVRRVLKALNIYYFMPATGGYGRSGVPDIVGCVNGRFVAIECKAGLNQPTALQEREMKNIKDAGGVAVVINEGSVRGLADLLRGLKAR